MARKLRADFIFDGQQLLPNAVLTVSAKGEVLSLTTHSEEPEQIEYFEGILCPGFINAHCHLELSHLKGKVSRGNGLAQFVKELVPKRLAPGSEIDAAIQAAEAEMLRNGIVGVGDICNSEATFPTKAISAIRYHSFMEIFSPDPNKAANMLAHGKTLEKRMKQMYPRARVSVTPHAPYSVSDKLYALLSEHCYTSDYPLSIHNQETPSEDEFFLHASGAMFDLMKAFYPGMADFKPTGYRSLPSHIVKLPKCNPLLLVHNTQTQAADIEKARQYNPNLWFCLCPKANLYIENQLPELGIFMDYLDKVVVGTDSLASNDTLSVLEELKTLKQHFPAVSTADLLRWGTSNPAKFFGWKDFGRFESGSFPGVNWLKNTENGEITSNTKVEVLL